MDVITYLFQPQEKGHYLGGGVVVEGKTELGPTSVAG